MQFRFFKLIPTGTSICPIKKHVLPPVHPAQLQNTKYFMYTLDWTLKEVVLFIFFTTEPIHNEPSLTDLFIMSA